MNARRKDTNVFNPTSTLFLRSVKNGDTKTVKRFLMSSLKEFAQSFEVMCLQPITKNVLPSLVGFDKEHLSESCISFSDWFEAVHIAKNCRFRGILDILFKFEKIFDAVTTDHWTVLHLAMFHCQNQIENGRLETVKILMKSGRIDVNALTNQLENVLHFACRCCTSDKIDGNDLENLIQKLLRYRVNVNQRNLSGQTALMIACNSECVAGVRALLNGKYTFGDSLDINARDNYGQTALSIAKQRNNVEIVALIEQTLFLIAIENGDTEAVKIYLSHSGFERQCLETDGPSAKRFRADLNVQSPLSISIAFPVWFRAFFIAYSNCYDGILKLLLSEDYLFQEVSEDGQTILHLVMKEYLADTGKYNKRSQKNKISAKFNSNALNSCNLASYGKLKFRQMLKILLEYGVDLNRRNINGQTVLMFACEMGRADIVKTLLNSTREHEIYLDIDAVDNSGETALMISKRNKHSDIVNILNRATFLSAVENGNVDMIKNHLAKNGNCYYRIANRWNSLSYCKDFTKWTFQSENEVDYSTWVDALHIAIRKSSEDILRLLLDHDVVVQSQENDDGDPILHRIFGKTNDRDQRLLRLIESVLETGRLNVNAINFDAQIALHSIFYSCHDKKDFFMCDGDHTKEIPDVITTLLRHGVNVNGKDKNGDTPLAIASHIGCTSSVGAMLNWAKKTGAWLDLDARDREGRTALMKAAIWKHTDVVELLLNAGASVNLSDYRGFTALHLALHEPTRLELWINFGDLPRSLDELKKRLEIYESLRETTIPRKCFKRSRIRLDDDKMKTVNLLLRREDVDVNSLNCEGYSPLDIAETSILGISSAIIDILKRKGASSNVFRRTYQQSSSNVGQDFKFGRCIRRSVCERPAIVVSRNALSQPGDAIKKEIIPGRDLKERTAFHRAVISHQDNDFSCESTDIVEMFISLGCSVSKTDIYRRTLLHYANNKELVSLHLSDVADRATKDRNNITANNVAKHEQELKKSTSRDRVADVISRIGLRVFKPYRHNGTTEKKNKSFDFDDTMNWYRHSNNRKIPEKIWRVGSYAFRYRSVKQITEEVKGFVEMLAAEISSQDSRFQVRPILVGSAYEGTKIDLPDEFDFDLVLTKISELCEVFTSPELPTGFVRLRRKQNQRHETSYNSFFSDDGKLNTERLNAQFKILLTNVLKDTKFILNQQKFKWDRYFRTDGLAPLYETGGRITTLELKKMKLNLDNDDDDYVEMVSIDILPCIHIDGWWPKDAIYNVCDDIKAFGCNLVFDRPQRLYPWVPYSESCVRISFAPAESELIKRSSETAKQAFMIAKQLITRTQSGFTHILKNCLLYCIEAFTPSEINYKRCLESDLNRSKDLRFLLESLMKCHLDFVLQDFCPCYFMPTFSLPIQDYLKSYCMRYFTSHEHIVSELSVDAFRLSQCVSGNVSKRRLQSPSLNPIWEHFDRKQIVEDMGKDTFKNLEID